MSGQKKNIPELEGKVSARGDNYARNKSGNPLEKRLELLNTDCSPEGYPKLRSKPYHAFITSCKIIILARP